ncbi:MAG: MBL fold metallo-hydrolase, partial [Cutibacterium sp.]|nr:MBL fold metallo-hydrolase [Cutibacterium sp.]
MPSLRSASAPQRGHSHKLGRSASEEQPGVDLILPDFSYIKNRLDKVDALVLTHGHEDHIGGVPYLLKLRPDIPLIGSKLTLAFVDAK